MPVEIHPTSIIEPGAELGEGVRIGPFCTVGPKVKLGEGVELLSHVAVSGRTTVGARTKVWPFTVLGAAPQDTKYKGEDTELLIGADNIIREQSSFHIGTPTGRGRTVVGDGGFYMQGSHIAHDCIIGNKVVLGNQGMLAGNTVMGDFAILGGNVAVHQFVRIGPYAMIGGGSALVSDVIPFGMTDNHGRLGGLNLVGMKRRGYSRPAIHALRRAYRDLFHGEGLFEERRQRVAGGAVTPEIKMVLDFIDAGDKRPLCLPRGGEV